MSRDHGDDHVREHEHESEADVAAYLKERVYATFTGLAIVLVLAANVDEHTAEAALFSLVIGVLGITVAGYASDMIAHLAVHRTLPERSEHGRMIRVAGGAISTVILPAILLGLAWAGVFQLVGALRAVTIVYLVTLAAIAYLAVRRARLSWWMQLAALLSLVLLGGIVVVLQTLAHAD
ncbi:MAG: hypothetical protein ABWX82_04255 [Leifsonia sp.]